MMRQLKILFPFIAKIFSTGITLGSTLLATWVLVPSEFGCYATVLSVAFVFTLITDWGLNLSGARALMDIETSTGKVDFIKRTVMLKAIIVTLVLAIMLILGAIYRDGALSYILLLSIGLIASNIFNVEWAARGLNLANAAVLRPAINGFIQFVILLAVFRLGLAGKWAFLGLSISAFISHIALFRFVSRRLGLRWFELLPSYTYARLSFVEVINEFKGGTVLFFAYLTSNFFMAAPQIWLGLTQAADEAGKYSTYYTILTNVVAPLTISQTIYLPVAANSEKTLAFEHLINNQLMILPLYSLWAEDIYQLLYGHSFAYDRVSSFLSMCVVALICCEFKFTTRLLVKGYTKDYMKIYVSSLVLSTLLFIFYRSSMSMMSAQFTFVILIVCQALLVVHGLFRLHCRNKLLSHDRVMMVFVTAVGFSLLIHSVEILPVLKLAISVLLIAIIFRNAMSQFNLLRK